MNVYFYDTFNKRDNSTLRPNIIDTSQFDTHACTLKHDCSEHDPILLLNSGAFNYVYAYIPDWHKYYYVVDVISKANNLVEYHLSEDLLGTYRANIYATKSRIMYSSTNYDTDIIDSRIKVKNSRNISFVTGTVPITGSTPGYIVTVFNTAYSNPSTGMSTSYLLSEEGMNKFRRWIRQTGIASGISQFMNGKFLDAIFSCIWVPYYDTLTAMTGAVSETDQIVVGDTYGTSVFTIGSHDCYIIEGRPIISHTNTIGTGLRYSDFRQYEPYTSGVLFLPGIGTIAINKQEWQLSSIVVVSDIDAVTGDIKYFLKNESNCIVSECNGNISSNCPLGQMVTNVGGMMSGIGQTAASAASLVGAIGAAAATEGAAAPLLVGAAVSTIAGIANTVLSANQHMPSISGGNSNRLASIVPDVMYFELSVNTEDPNDASYIALQGRPYNGVATIGTLVPTPANPIYVQCIDARVASSATDGGVNMRPNLREQQEINNFLNSGFYYE